MQQVLQLQFRRIKMRYAILNTIDEARNFAYEVQKVCDANTDIAHMILNIPMNSHIKICAFPLRGRWAVAMPIEPSILVGEIVDTLIIPEG
jgi:hypothetical protein